MFLLKSLFLTNFLGENSVAEFDTRVVGMVFKRLGNIVVQCAGNLHLQECKIACPNGLFFTVKMHMNLIQINLAVFSQALHS